MTQEELNAIIDKDQYFQERKKPSEFDEKMFLREVGFHCPLCGEEIMYRAQKKHNKLFQIAHIFPNRPTLLQYETLKDVEKLGGNSESFENKIALCFKCHNTQDYHTTVEEYNHLLCIKKHLLEETVLNDTIRALDIEHDISIVVERLTSFTETELSTLNYNPIDIANKFENGELLIKTRVANYVQIFYPYVRDCLKEIDGKNGFNQQVLAGQMRNCYLKLKDKCDDKSKIFNQMVDWLKNKTQSTSKEACEVVIAFFVQNCEVFDEITK